MTDRRLHSIAWVIACLLLSACSSAVRWEPKPAPVVVKTTPSPTSRLSTSIGASVVKTASRQVGAPYRFGGASPKGFDCSGLVHYAYRNAGLRVPRTTTSLYRTARPVSLNELQLGDILFFYFDDKIGHVAIYTGGRSFVHAPSSGKYVVRGSLESRFWRQRLVSAGRLY